VITLGIFMAIGGAKWLFSILGLTSKVIITSEEPITYTSNLDTQELDVTNSGAQIIDTLDLSSNDGDTILTISWVEDIVYEETQGTYGYGSYCEFNESDITITLKYDNTEITNPETVELLGGETKTIEIIYDIEQWTCNSIATVIITVTST